MATPASTPSEAAERANDGSVLVPAALALLGASATADELEARLRGLGLAPDPGLAAGLLDQLTRLGLVRATRRTTVGQRYAPTSLGARMLDARAEANVALGLEELERLRTDLLSTIAHELRTPLTSVRTSVGLLLDPASQPTEEQRAALLHAIERNADRMQRIVADILEISRFRAGGVALQLRRFGATALAEVSIATIAPLAAQRGQRIVVTSRLPRSHEVYGDRRRLEQALVNLLANAQRFSPEGGEVEVSVEARGELTAWAVADHGPGIPDGDRGRLFERFFVGRSDRSAPREGVGLGLPTALAIAQAHGGTIEVESEVGVGSTFTLVVPTRGPDDEP